MSQSQNHKIKLELQRIEAANTIRILYACESGSRAWGFESEDSDFDVRFIYIRPPNWYLTIQKKRDVIEVPINDKLDISGWDLPKALNLFRKSNPPLLEWLQSPIVYREEGSMVKRVRQLLPKYYSPISCLYHYLHMARGNNREYLQGDTVWIKKYFYVLRPILACMWIENGFGVVPTEFRILVEHLINDKHLENAIAQLIEQKKSGRELDQGARINEISDFINHQLSRLSVNQKKTSSTNDPQELDTLFVELLEETYGSKIVPVA